MNEGGQQPFYVWRTRRPWLCRDARKAEIAAAGQLRRNGSWSSADSDPSRPPTPIWSRPSFGPDVREMQSKREWKRSGNPPHGGGRPTICSRSVDRDTFGPSMIACHGRPAPCQIYQANAGGCVDDRLRRPASAFRFPSKLGKRKMLAFAHIPTGTTTTTGVADDDSNTVALRHVRDLVVLPSPPNRQVTSLSVRNRDFSNSRRH